ncbi:MAG TPA: hypothetical protein VGP36_00585, partial [Mycobacteriales bacterium]|nr:hypothetical protein [Mycobacteriales bacterium]
MDTTMSSLNVASPDCAEPFYRGRLARCRNLQRAGSLAELREILDRRVADVADVADVAASPATLDLIGHSTRDHHLLRLGATPIDMLDRQVARFFSALAEDQLLPRQQIVAVRLLGCETAVTDGGQRTLRMLAHTLNLPVYGTSVRLLKSHSNADGFNPAFSHILVEAS